MKKLLVLGLILITGCSFGGSKIKINRINENGVDVIKNDSVIGEKNVDGLTFKNTTFNIENGVTTIITEITNRTDTAYNITNYKIIVTDKDNAFLASVVSTINETLEPGQSTSVPVSFEGDLKEASNVQFKLNVNE